MISQCYRTMIISQRIAVTLGIIEFVRMLIVNIDTLTAKHPKWLNHAVSSLWITFIKLHENVGIIEV